MTVHAAGDDSVVLHAYQAMPVDVIDDIGVEPGRTCALLEARAPITGPEGTPMNPASTTRSAPDAGARLLLTVEEAAQMLGIGRTLAYALVSAGELPSVTLGRLRRIPVAGLRTWVESLPATPTPSD